MANDSKYGRLYPERAVAPLRYAVKEALATASLDSGVAQTCIDALDDVDRLGFPPDEPLFLLRGQDELAADAVRFYADLVDHRLAGHGAPEAGLDREHIDAFADRMEAWEPRKLPD